MAQTGKSLGEKSVAATLWGSGGAAIKFLLQFAVQVAMARLLGPAEFGLFAIGAIVVAFSNFLADIGIAYRLIQAEAVLDEDVRFVVAWQLILGTALTLAISLGANHIAALFSEPHSATVLRWLAVVCLINALAAPSLNLLKRSLDFRRIQIAQVTGYVAGYLLIGLPLAFATHDALALVAAWLVQACVTTAVMYGSVRHPWHPLLWHSRAAATFRYGLMVLSTNLTNWAIGNVDRLVVGRLFAAGALAPYAVASTLVTTPAATLLGIVQPVFFAASSRVAGNAERVVPVYLSLVALVTLLVLPVMAAVSVMSDAVVATLYGPAWRSAAEVLRPLALAVPFYVLWGLTTPLIWAGERPEREAKAQLPLAVLWILVCWLAAQHSVAAVAWAVLALTSVRYFVVVCLAARLVHFSARQVWRAARGGLAITSAIVAMLYVLNTGLAKAGLPAAALLMIGGLIAAAALVALPLAFARLQAPELHLPYGHIRRRLPARWQRYADRYFNFVASA